MINSITLCNIASCSQLKDQRAPWTEASSYFTLPDKRIRLCYGPKMIL